mmetsp:Transcript_2572/g.4845  ORF Transcript_2572/g.4845 Transcript_2572/m.4845 type:complete len:317 (+) Transcript_2572:266-1216(+)
MLQLSTTIPSSTATSSTSSAPTPAAPSRTSSCLLHPVALFSILDAYTRRSKGQARVIGTLLGKSSDADPTVVEVTQAFAVPYREAEDGEIAIGKEHQRQMMSLLSKVSAHERVVGWYAGIGSGPVVVDATSLIHDFYASECDDPVHVVVDCGCGEDKLDVNAYVSTPLTVGGEPIANMFEEVKLDMTALACEKIFVDRMVRSNTAGGDTEGLGSVISGPGSAPPGDSVMESMDKLSRLLHTVHEYVDSVVSGRVSAPESVGRMIASAVGSVPAVTDEAFTKLFNDSLQDLLMVMYLSNITKTQLTVAEKVAATLTV